MSTNNKLIKLFWSLILVTALITSVNVLYQFFEEWNENPIISTFEAESMSLESIQYPTITLCHPQKYKDSKQVEYLQYYVPDQ